ncbi:MAG: lysophospholipid acyltransferase family protein [Nannocystaceae bacterium]
MWPSLVSRNVAERLDALDVPFNRYGMDPFGISKRHLGAFFSALEPFYRRYFQVRCFGIENVPRDGAAMLIGNHSGGIPTDGGMIISSLFLDHDPPRLAHGMVEKFAQNWPFVSQWFSRIGQLPGLPEHATRLLEDGRCLLVFPEGARGTGKLYKNRYHMVRFGTGFMRIALQTRTPIVPLAFIGGEEVVPTIYHAKSLARLVGAPYWPVTPYLLPLPLPLPCEIHFGKPMRFEGTGDEPDAEIERHVDQVKNQIARLIVHGCAIHGQRRAGLDYEGRGDKP